MNFEFFAYWNGAQIRDLFEIIVSITSGPDFLGLLRTMALLGILCVMTIAALRYRGMDAISFFMAIVVFYTVLLVPKVDLTIRDDRAGSVHVVQHVPLGVAFLASTTSHVGHWLTETFESNFADTDAERFSCFGVVFPERAVTALAAVGPVTPAGRQLITNFNRQCVVPELIDYPEKLQALTSSTNLWNTVATAGWVNPARQTQDTTGAWISCSDAIAVIQNHLNNVEIPAIQNHLALQLVPDRVDPSAVISQVLPQAESLLLGVSRSLAESIRHSVFMNTIPKDVNSVAALSEQPLAIATAMAHAQGNLASEINYRTMAKIAEDALPKVRNALEFVIIGCFPLLFIMILASGHRAGMIIRSYLTLLVWIQLWAPISAVINYLIIHVDANPMTRIIDQYGGNTLMAANLIREFGASSQAIAGYLMMLAPVIAFAIAKGSDIATSQMVGSIMAPAQGAAQSQGASLAAGNVTMGNASWGNVSTNATHGNKHDTATTWASPSTVSTQNAYGSVMRTGQGAVTGFTATPIAMGVTAMSAVGQNTAQGASSSLSAGFTHQSTDSLQVAQNVQSGDRYSAGFANLLAQTVNRSSTLNESSQSSTGMTDKLSHSVTDTHARRFENAEGAAYSSAGGLGFNASQQLFGGKASQSPVFGLDGKGANTALSSQGHGTTDIGSNLRITNTQNLVDTATGLNASASSQERTAAYQQLVSAARSIASSTNDSGIRSAAQSFEAQLTHAHQMAQNQSLSRSSSQEASRHRAFVSNQDIRTMMDNNPMALQKAIDTFGSAERAQEVLFHSAIARSAFAQNLQSDNLRSQSSYTKPYPITPEAVDRLGTEHRTHTTDGFVSQLDQSRAQTLSTATNAQDQITERPLGSMPNDHSINELISHREDWIAQRRESTQAQMEVERGAQRAARVLYQARENGMTTLLGNALFGAIQYQSPQGYQDTLRVQADIDLAMRKTLAEIGSSERQFTANEFEKRYRELKQRESADR